MVLDLRFCSVACASEDSGTQFALLLVTVSLERMKISECCRYESRSEPGGGKLTIIENAPGSYVRVRSAA